MTYEPPAISLRAFGVPAAVDAVVARGMCKSKEGRWWDIGEFAHCLIEASRGADFAFREAPGFGRRIAVAENDPATQDIATHDTLHNGVRSDVTLTCACAYG